MRQRSLTCIATVLCLAAGYAASAADYTWTQSGASGPYDWTTSGNWGGSGQFVSGTANGLVFYADTTTALNGSGGATDITANIPATLTLNTLTLNGKGPSAGSNQTVTIGSAASTWTFDGTTPAINLNGVNGTKSLSYIVAANLGFNANTTFTGAGSASFTLSGSLTGGSSVTLTKQGSSTLIVTGTNSGFNGNWVIASGLLSLNNSNAASASNVFQVNSSGTLRLINSNTIAGLTDNAGSGGSITNSSGGAKTLTVAGSGTYSFAGAFAGATNGTKVNIAVSGSGTQILGGSNVGNVGTMSVTGAGGTLVFSNTNAIFQGLAGAVVTSGSTQASLSVSANSTAALGVGSAASGSFDAAAIATFLDASHMGASSNSAGFRNSSILGFDTTNAGGSFTYSTPLTEIGTSTGIGFAKLGTGTLILSATNTYTGVTQVRGGTLEIGGAGQLAASGTYGGAIANAGVLAFTSSAAQTLSGTISGAGSLVKSGAATLTLSSTANSWSGGTTLNAGVLAFATNALGTGTVTLNGGTLQWSTGNVQDVSAQLALVSGSTATLDTNGNDVSLASGLSGNAISAALTKAGSGRLTLSGTNAYTGATTISSGTLEIGGAGQLGGGSYAGAVSNAGVLAVTTSAAQTFSGAISGGGSLVKSGGGTLTLSNAANSWSGGTTLNAGVLTFGTSALSSGTVTLNGGTLRWATGNMQDVSAQLALVSGSTATFDTNGNDVSLATALGGGAISAALTKAGAGRLALTATNAYTGATTISSGTLEIGGAGQLGGGSYAGAISNAGVLAFTSSVAQTLSGAISGAGSLVKSGGATLTLSNAANSWSGGTTLNGGSFLASSQSLGSGAVTIGGTGVQLKMNGVSGGTATLSNAITVGAVTGFSGQGVIDTATGVNGILTGTITINGTPANGGHFGASSTGSLTINGPINSASVPVVQVRSRVIYAGGGSYAAFTLSGGTAALGANDGLSTSAAVTFSGSSVALDLAGYSQSLAGISRSGANPATIGNSSTTADSTLTITGTSTFSGAIVDAIGAGTRKVSLAVNGGRLTLSGSNTYSGQTRVSSGTLQLGSSTALPTSSALSLGTGSTAGVLAFNGNTATLGAITFYGSGSQLNDTGKLNLLASGTASAAITVASGSHALHPDTTLQSDTVINVAADSLFSLHGKIDGSKSLTKIGSGTLTVYGNNSYSGGTYLSGGYLTMVNTGALGSGTVTISGNSILNLNNQILSNAVVFGSGSGAIINSGTVINVAGTYSITSGTGGSITTNYSVQSGAAISFVNSLASTVYVQGTAVGTFSSDVLSGGTVIVNAGGRGIFSAGVAGNVTTSGSSLFSGDVLGSVTVAGGTATFDAATGEGSALNVDSGLAVVNGTIRNMAHATAAGATLEIRGQVASTADVNAEAGGIVKLMGSQAFDASTLENNGSVIVDRAANLVLAAVISGSGNLTKLGTGKLTLSGSSTYSGATTVSAGALAVDGQIISSVNVATGATLGGSGVIAGSVGGDGLIAPGNSPGILTVQGQVDPTSSTSFAFEFMKTGDPIWSNGTGSMNDVLRLTNADPFVKSLTSSNVVNVYFDVSSLTNGDIFRGGFFSDFTSTSLNFASEIGSPTYAYYVLGSGSGSHGYNGKNYSTLSEYLAANAGSGISGVTASVVTVQSADFSGGTINNGQVTQFVIVPEPGTVIFAGIGIAMAGWSLGKRRITTHHRPKS